MRKIDQEAYKDTEAPAENIEMGNLEVYLNDLNVTYLSFLVLTSLSCPFLFFTV